MNQDFASILQALAASGPQVTQMQGAPQAGSGGGGPRSVRSAGLSGGGGGGSPAAAPPMPTPPVSAPAGPMGPQPAPTGQPATTPYDAQGQYQQELDPAMGGDGSPDMPDPTPLVKQ